MSPNVNNFVTDLVTMAKALENEPGYRAEIERLASQVEDYAKQVQRLEIKLLDKNSEIEAAKTTIRSLEVERDDAQFHALEADDRTQRALDFIKATFGNAGSLIQALDPPKAITPTPDVSVSAMPEAASEVTQGQSEPLPSATAEIGHGNTSSPVISADIHSHDAPSAPEVAAQPGEPSANSSSPQSGAQSVHSANVENATSASPQSDGNVPDASSAPASNAYAGRTYSSVCRTDNHIPTKSEWIAGGGTEDNWWA